MTINELLEPFDAFQGLVQCGGGCVTDRLTDWPNDWLTDGSPTGNWDGGAQEALSPRAGIQPDLCVQQTFWSRAGKGLTAIFPFDKTDSGNPLCPDVCVCLFHSVSGLVSLPYLSVFLSPPLPVCLCLSVYLFVCVNPCLSLYVRVFFCIYVPSLSSVCLSFCLSVSLSF